MFSIGKHFSDVRSTLKVDCGSICGWVFFHRYRQTQLSGLCLPTTGMDFQGDRTMAGTVTGKLSPLISQNTLIAQLTHPHSFASAHALVQSQSRCFVALDAEHCFGVVREVSRESVEKSHGGKHKF